MSAKLFRIRTTQELAELLGVTLQQLTYALWGMQKADRYREFTVPKKSGGVRTIASPHPFLKALQRRLYKELLAIYRPKAVVHGFVPGRSIVGNASVHANRRLVLNVDLVDFFPTINFGRVRGLFMSKPFNFPPDVATAIAQLCTHNGVLPQGAPTSPIISNMICGKMDAQLRDLACRLKCSYSRYADDLTFSTTRKEFPKEIILDLDGELVIGNELDRIIASNGFRPNLEKLRLYTRHMRQEVTGLVVNSKPNVRRTYIRRIRGMLHAWEKYGLQAAEQEYRDKYDRKSDYRDSERVNFVNVVRGSIEFVGMVKGTNDPVFQRLFRKFAKLYPAAIERAVRLKAIEVNLEVRCEGKTDPIHLRSALRWLQKRGEFVDLHVEFRSGNGSDRLLKELKVLAANRIRQKMPIVFLFDRDESSIIKEVDDPTKGFKRWNDSSIFSMALPVPQHRSPEEPLSIEFLYSDKDLFRADAHGRRLFVTSEFDSRTLKLKADPTVNTTARNKVQQREQGARILDAEVYDERGRNIALSKADFASLIENREGTFGEVDFSGFRQVFRLFSIISAEHAAS